MHKLDEHQAFEAMTRFLWRYFEEAGNDVATLLGDIALEADGLPVDPAAWEDWMRIINVIAGGGPIDDGLPPAGQGSIEP